MDDATFEVIEVGFQAFISESPRMLALEMRSEMVKAHVSETLSSPIPLSVAFNN